MSDVIGQATVIVDATTTKFDQAMAGVADKATKGAAAAGTAFGVSTNKLQVFAQGLDDLQYVGEQGLRPILNNLVQLSPALGIAALAVQMLISNWDSLVNAFGGGHVKTQADEMEELRKKTSLTADEAERLARASQLKGKVDELRAGLTEDQQSSDAAASKAIIEAGYKNVAAGVLRARPDLVDSQGDAALAKDELKKAKAGLEFAKEGAGESLDANAVASATDRVREAEQKLLTARHKTAEELAATGALSKLFPGGAKQLEEMVKKNPDAFGPESGKLVEALKEAQKTAKDKEVDEAVKQAGLDAENTDFKDRHDDLRKEAEEEEYYRKQDEQNNNKLVNFQEQQRISREDRQKASAGITDAASFHNEVQTSILKNGPAALETETRRAADETAKLTAINVELTKALQDLKKGIPAKAS